MVFAGLHIFRRNDQVDSGGCRPERTSLFLEVEILCDVVDELLRTPER